MCAYANLHLLPVLLCARFVNTLYFYVPGLSTHFCKEKVKKPPSDCATYQKCEKFSRVRFNWEYAETLVLSFLVLIRLKNHYYSWTLKPYQNDLNYFYKKIVDTVHSSMSFFAYIKLCEDLLRSTKSVRIVLDLSTIPAIHPYFSKAVGFTEFDEGCTIRYQTFIQERWIYVENRWHVY